MSAKARAFQYACRARLAPSLPVSRLPTTNDHTLTTQRCVTTRSASNTSSSGSGGSRNSTISRRAITVTSDDGRYNWSELSTGEKAARTTQQSFNFLLVVAGAAGTLTVAYLLYTDVFSSTSYTRQFNTAVDRIRASAECRDLLGSGGTKIKAYGEPTSNKWARARPIAHNVEEDKFGTLHLRMHFYAEGTDARGLVNLHMTKRKDEDELKYEVLSLTVPDHETVYLENRDGGSVKKKVGKMFGVQWR